MNTGVQPVAVKRVRRRSVSTSGAKRGRPPFVNFDDRRGNKWRIYFRLPPSISEVPRQMVVTSIGDTHTLHAYGQGGGNITIPVIAALVIDEGLMLKAILSW